MFDDDAISRKSHPGWRTEAMVRCATNHDSFEPEATVTINRAVFKKHNVSFEDQVNITARRCSITLKSRPDLFISRGMMFVNFGFLKLTANISTDLKLGPVRDILKLKNCAIQIRPSSMRLQEAKFKNSTLSL